MLARFLSLLLRVTVELALVLLVIAAILGVFSWRVARRLVVSRPDSLDGLGGRLEQAFRFAAAFAPATREPVDSPQAMVDE